MPFKYSLETLNRLSDVCEPKHIKSLSHALYPGTHCPLFGATMAACELQGLEALVIGTDECTYYTQAFAIDRIQVQNNFWSYVMGHQDVVFGSSENVVEAVRTIYKKRTPQVILLITTCIPEITGEDFDSLAIQMTEELEIPVLCVHTEHFRCNSHISGIEGTLTVLAGMMKKQPVKEKTLNILGHRFGSLENSELFRLLFAAGFTVNLSLPSKSTVDAISTAPSAMLNVVTDFTALPLAKKMKELFDTPYVVFDKFLSPERIDRAYAELQETLHIDWQSTLSESRDRMMVKLAEAKERLAGKTFVYGNSVMAAFEVVSFLCTIGMRPLIVQARDLYPNDDIYIREILDQNENPYVASIANIAPLRTIYPQLKPNFYIGHENPMLLMQHGILHVTFDAASAKLGYELVEGVLGDLLDGLDGAKNPMLAMMEGGGR